MLSDDIKKDLQKLASKERAKNLSWFFKTGKGQYGEGDVFIGIKVPEQRVVAKKHYKSATLKDIGDLLKSRVHEHRLTALIILVYKSQKATEEERKSYFDFYLKNTKHINNWDLVDLTSRDIIGKYILKNPTEKAVIYKLARSKALWEKRISIIATSAFIGENKFEDTLKIAEILLNDSHDLIHKAVGWMLREIGKRDQKTEETFLKKHCRKMPRTMLRYAIEKFPEQKRQFYLKKS